jgi:hypothetical protein
MVCRGNKTVKRISPPGLGLSLETVQAFGLGSELGRQDLEGDIALETGIVGAVDLPHPPGPEGREDLVGAEACSGRQRHAATLPGVMRPARAYPSLRLTAREMTSGSTPKSPSRSS